MFRILVVEDEPANAHLLREVVKYLRSPPEMYFARDGREALEFLYSRRSASWFPDLILLDMNMPGMDGLQTLSAIKGDSELGVIPIIMLSSVTSPEVVRRAYEAHANCYVVKPSDLRETRQLVEAVEAFWMNFSQRPWNAGIIPKQSPVAEAVKGGAVGSPSHHFQDLMMSGAEFGSSAHARHGCEEHGRLRDGFGAAVREVLVFHEQQFLAIVEGDPESNRFDLLIHTANERKQRAKYAYMHHVEAHACTESKMPLSKLEREVLTDSMLKVQSIQASLEHIDDSKIPKASDIHDCLEAADHNLRDALREVPEQKHNAPCEPMR